MESPSIQINLRQNPSAIYRSHIPALTGPSTSTHSLGSSTVAHLALHFLSIPCPILYHTSLTFLRTCWTPMGQKNERTNRPNVYGHLHTFSSIPLCVFGRTNWNVSQRVRCIVPALLLRCILHLHIFWKTLILNGRYDGDAPSAFSRYVIASISSGTFIPAGVLSFLASAPPSSTYIILL